MTLLYFLQRNGAQEDQSSRKVASERSEDRQSGKGLAGGRGQMLPDGACVQREANQRHGQKSRKFVAKVFES